MRSVNVYIAQPCDCLGHLGFPGLGDPWTAVASGAGLVASAAAGGSASLLATVGIAANVVPVVGQIASTVAIIAGYILAAKAKSKAIRNNISEIETQQKELRLQIVEIDKAIASASAERADIYRQLQAIGLNGFTDWLKKTFTPGKYYGEIQDDAVAEYNRLSSEFESKIGALESIQLELQSLSDKLTGAKAKRIAIYTASGIGAAGVLYLTAKKIGWI